MKKSWLIAVLIVFLLTGEVSAEWYRYNLKTDGTRGDSVTVIGGLWNHTVKEKETLLDIARDYGLGYNEISLYYPDIDPWIPKKGRNLLIPKFWVLPPTVHEEIVINIPEMRLYRFNKNITMVKTYPIGVGRENFKTPVNVYRVVEMEKNPTWTTPPSAWAEYGKIVVPAGPQNPLGDYWVGLSADLIGIHGTNKPWGVGRLVSRGCIRLYPEHIQQFFNEVSVGERVETIYEPVKFGLLDDNIYIEVHPDVYGIIPDTYEHAKNILATRGYLGKVDLQLMAQCLEEQKGVPMIVGNLKKGW